VHAMSGPPDPSGMAHDLRKANALLREGMIALTKSEPRDLGRAERCFRAALQFLLEHLPLSHSKVSYAFDRIGLVCQMQERESEAHELYIRSLDPFANGISQPTIWNEITLLNLAILYGRHGRDAEKERTLKWLRRVQKMTRRRLPWQT
jgi:hypothetical protein